MDKHEKRLARQREYRKRTNNAATKRYEKTPKGFLMRKYRNMMSRVRGIQKKKAHLYSGLELLDRESFYGWAMSSSDFWKLYNRWVKSGYNRKLCPTVNRIDSRKGYLLNNIEWITHSENSRLGAISNWRTRRRYSPNLQETVRSRE